MKQIKTTAEQRNNLRVATTVAARATDSPSARLTLDLLDDFDAMWAELAALREAATDVTESAMWHAAGGIQISTGSYVCLSSALAGRALRRA